MITGFGFTLYIGPGYVVHWSTEDGWEFERAPHRTWRLGLVTAVRTGWSDRMTAKEAKRRVRQALLADLMGEAPVSSVGNLRRYHELLVERCEKALDA